MCTELMGIIKEVRVKVEGGRGIRLKYTGYVHRVHPN